MNIQYQTFFLRMFPKFSIGLRLDEQPTNFIKQVSLKSILLRYSLIFFPKCNGELSGIKIMFFLKVNIFDFISDHDFTYIFNKKAYMSELSSVINKKLLIKTH